MARRYLVDPLPASGPASLAGEVAHHLLHVLRIRPGEQVVLFDGRGGEAVAQVLAVAARALEVEVGARRQAPPLPRQVHLAVALPRWNRAEWLFEHATEVGVTTFHPLRSERARPPGERGDRWLKICIAAAGQCDRAHVPTVRPLRELDGFLADPDLPPERFLAAAGAPPLQAPADPGRAAVLLVGPEGGFTAAEQEAARAAGFRPAGLGPLVLRSETAALVGAALLAGCGS